MLEIDKLNEFTYNVDLMRTILRVAMVATGGLALVNIVFNRSRWLSSAAFLLIISAAMIVGFVLRATNLLVHKLFGWAANDSIRGWTPIVTPNFHHWHHAQDQEALDRNYAAHYAFLDHLFGTAVKSTKRWPEQYGVLGDYVPNGFFKQLKFPFVWKG